MSATDDSDDPVRERVDLVHETIGHPVRSASVFYALLYAVDIAGAQQAAFDFKQWRERLAQGFLWYGVLAMTSEFGNAGTSYFIVGENVEDLLREERGELVDEHVEEFLFPDDPDVAERARVAFRQAPTFGVTSARTRASATRLLKQTDSLFNSLDDPLNYIRLIRDIFEATPSPGRGRDLLRQNNESGWSVGFEGPAWVSIGDHLLRHDDLGDTAWVDQCWSIQHNNNRWIDKVNTANQELETIGVILGIDDPRFGDMVRLLNSVLDAAEAGEIGAVFDVAQEYSLATDINLRRLRQSLGV